MHFWLLVMQFCVIMSRFSLTFFFFLLSKSKVKVLFSKENYFISFFIEFYEFRQQNPFTKINRQHIHSIIIIDIVEHWLWSTFQCNFLWHEYTAVYYNLSVFSGTYVYCIVARMYTYMCEIIHVTWDYLKNSYGNNNNKIRVFVQVALGHYSFELNSHIDFDWTHSHTHADAHTHTPERFNEPLWISSWSSWSLKNSIHTHNHFIRGKKVPLSPEWFPGEIDHNANQIESPLAYQHVFGRCCCYVVSKTPPYRIAAASNLNVCLIISCSVWKKIATFSSLFR